MQLDGFGLDAEAPADARLGEVEEISNQAACPMGGRRGAGHDASVVTEIHLPEDLRLEEHRVERTIFSAAGASIFSKCVCE